MKVLVNYLISLEEATTFSNESIQFFEKEKKIFFVKNFWKLVNHSY